MSSHRRLVLRRTAIVVFVFGSGIAAFVWVLSYSRGLADDGCAAGENGIYLATGRQLCGERARKFCLRTQDRRDREDAESARTCAEVLRRTRTTAPEG